MKCQSCKAKLDKGSRICPECGEETTRPATWVIVLMSVAVAALLILFTCLILVDQGVDINPLHWFNQEEEPWVPEYDLQRDDYTAAEEDVQTQAAAVVCVIDGLELTNAQLQFHYWRGVYDFVDQYEYYLDAMGLDLSKPLSQQYTPEGESWQKFFLQNGIYNWHKYASLALQAKEEGYQMSQEQQEKLESMGTTLEGYAQQGKYESVDAMLKAEFGSLCSLEEYMVYLSDYYLAVEYFNTKYADMKPTDDQLETYFAEHETELANQGITKDSKNYDVRHILLQPEGDTEDATEYTEQQWEACRQKAQQMLDDWKAGDGTEEGFAQLANTHSTDGGSNSNGGLYTDLNESTNFVTEFKEWYLDESRQVGDTGLVKTSYGYHIMYFSASETNWQSTCYNEARAQMAEDFVLENMKKREVTVHDDRIAIGEVVLVTVPQS